MNNEEKEAINKLKKDIKLSKDVYNFIKIELKNNSKDTTKEDLEFVEREIKINKTLLNLIKRQEKEIKEWCHIADDILKATGKYGEISIGEVAKYISELRKGE